MSLICTKELISGFTSLVLESVPGQLPQWSCPLHTDKGRRYCPLYSGGGHFIWTKVEDSSLSSFPLLLNLVSSSLTGSRQNGFPP